MSRLYTAKYASEGEKGPMPKIQRKTDEPNPNENPIGQDYSV
jgi:hypothetical protein